MTWRTPQHAVGSADIASWPDCRAPCWESARRLLRRALVVEEARWSGTNNSHCLVGVVVAVDSGCANLEFPAKTTIHPRYWFSRRGKASPSTIVLFLLFLLCCCRAVVTPHRHPQSFSPDIRENAYCCFGPSFGLVNWRARCHNRRDSTWKTLPKSMSLSYLGAPRACLRFLRPDVL